MAHKFKKRQREPENLSRYREVVNKFVLDATLDDDRNKLYSKKPSESRRERRKKERRLKKMRKFAFHHHDPLPTMETLQQKKRRKNNNAPKQAKQTMEKNIAQDAAEGKSRKKKKRKQSVSVEETRKKALIESNEVEEKNIKQLEKHLKLHKRKSKNLPQSFVSDGLDFLLMPLDNNDGGEIEGENVWKMDDDDITSKHCNKKPTAGDKCNKAETNFLGTKTRVIKSKQLGKKNSVSEDDDDGLNNNSSEDESDHDDDDDNDGLNSSDNSDTENDDSDVNNNDEHDDHDDSEEIDFESDNEDEEGENRNTGSVGSDEDSDGENEQSKPGSQEIYREDIYGRLRDAEGNVVQSANTGMYVPRFKRNEGSSNSLEKERVKKQLKGLSNRLSEATLQSISAQIAQMFGTYSRALVNECLIEVVMEACVWHEPVPERIIMELCAMIAILHVNIGNEIGAYVLQEWVKKFDVLFREGSHESKEMDNVLVMLCQLYNFKVVHSVLIFDVMEKLTNRFSERDIECLLLMLRSIGFILRKDDATSLKDAILSIQTKAATVDVSCFEDPSRVKFMLEVLLAVKNNNMRKIPNYNPEYAEHVIKVIQSAIKLSSSGQNPLRISLKDLLEADENGRWWLIGSSWNKQSKDQFNNKSNAADEVDSAALMNKNLLELARKQRMNTNIRRNIFCTIMSSEDFVDAFEKLLRMKLNEKQEREIVHVIIDLCMQSKSFNPFFAYLAQKFCEFDRRFQMTTQFTLWDKFRILEELDERQRLNLSSLCAHLVTSFAMSLSIFKTLEFADLDTVRVHFLKNVLSSILTSDDESIVTRVFSRISSFAKLSSLKDGLKLFMRHFMLRSANSETIRIRVGLAEKALTSSDAVVRM